VGTAEIAPTGKVTLNTTGGIGSSTNRIQLDSTNVPSSVVIGSTIRFTSAVYLAGLGNLTLGAISTTNALLDVTGADNLNVSGAIAVGTAAVHLTSTGTDSSTFDRIASTAAITAGSATLIADRMHLDGGTLNVGTGASNSATLKANSANRLINLGPTTDPTGSLNLDSAELNSITAAILRIGSSSAGTLTVSATIALSKVTTLSLLTGGGIVQASGGLLQVSQLALSAKSGIGSSTPLFTQVSTLAFQNSSGNVQITNNGGMALAALDTLSTSFNNGGTTTLLAKQGFLTFAVNLTSAGNLKASTTESTSEPPQTSPEEDLTVNSNVTVASSKGTISFKAADSLTEQSGALIKSDIKGVYLDYRVGDRDYDGTNPLDGSVRGLPVLVNGKPLPVARQLFFQQPLNTLAGVGLTGGIEAFDRYGNLIPGATIAVQLNTGTVLGSVTTDSHGNASLSNLRIPQPGTYQLVVRVGKVSITSRPFTISPIGHWVPPVG